MKRLGLCSVGLRWSRGSRVAHTRRIIVTCNVFRLEVSRPIMSVCITVCVMSQEGDNCLS